MKAEPARNGYTQTVDRLLENGGFADAADNPNAPRSHGLQLTPPPQQRRPK